MGRSATKRHGEHLPSYQLHKPTNQAVVTLSGKDVYLGVYDTPASREKYRRVIAAWLANDKQPPKPSTRTEDDGEVGSLTVAELCLRFLAWADGHYRRPDGTPTPEAVRIRIALKSGRRA